MRELTSAIVSLPWAMWLFGVDQMAAVLARDREALTGATASLYRATQAVQDQLGDAFWALFQVGDAAQRSTVDAAFEAFSPRRWELVLAQLQNNLEVFNLVKGVRNVLNIPGRDVFALADLVREAYALGDYPDLWAIEGLGHDYADRFWERGGPIVGILRNESARGIPRSSLTMLHAGIGLSFAKNLLNDTDPYDSPERHRDLAARFVMLCRENSWSGYEGAAFESLGLVTRTWHPQMVACVDAAMRDVDERAREYFWHGAGRALYFHPLYIVPGVLSPWHAIDREPPDQTALLNMKAGLAWATVLVNIRHPRILDRIISAEEGRIGRDDAFANGVVSAVSMAQDITPHDEYIEALCAYVPDDRSGGDRWERLVGEPCRDASTRVQPALAAAERMGEVFRYHPYPLWFDAAVGVPVLPAVWREPVH
jgi:hypothetical protein